MFDFLNKSIQKKIANMDPDSLQKAMTSLSQIMNTEEGQKVLNQLKSVDKDTLVEKIKDVDEKNIAQKLNDMNLDDTLEKINTLDKNEITKVLNDNPEIMKELNKIMRQV